MGDDLAQAVAVLDVRDHGQVERRRPDWATRYLGVAVGECLGYLLTGTWTVLVAGAMLQSSVFEAWLAWPGIAVGARLVVGSFEFVGGFEENGWKLAGTIVPIAYTGWSLWLVATGIVLLA